jgi:signal transduction histidine kinase
MAEADAESRWSLSVLLVVLVLVGGLAGSLVLVAAVQRQQRGHLSDVMDQRAQAVGEAVTGEVDRYTDTISDLAVAVGSQSELSAADFAALTSRLNRQRLPGVTGASLVVPASDQQIAGVQRHWRAAGNHDLVLTPFGTSRQHLFVVLSHPLDGSTAVTGGDVIRVDEPTQALLMARDRHQVTASPTYVLLKDRTLAPSKQQLSFVLATPVYGGAGTPDAGQFRGWILMGLRGGDFLSETMLQASQNTVAVSLLDASTPRETAVPVAHTGGDALSGQAQLRRTVPVDVAGRRWQLVVHPTRGMNMVVGPSRTATAGGIGILLTLLLSALVAALTSSRNRALAQVERATTALRDDIERREVVEAELREREAELQAFAGVVAHDLKSPLTNLTGYCNILLDEHALLLGETAGGYVTRIALNARRMWTLIDDLLCYTAARDSQLSAQPVDLGVMVRDVATELGDRLPHASQIDVGPLPSVEADPILLRQVLDNLIGNAIKYVHPGNAPQITVNADAGAGQWRIEVSDRGIGIHPDDWDAVFGTFHRARGSEGYPGTGLGLAICKRIIHRHNGQIGVSANPGGGSRFWFTLPAVIAGADQPDVDHLAGHLAGQDDLEMIR